MDENVRIVGSQNDAMKHIESQGHGLVFHLSAAPVLSQVDAQDPSTTLQLNGATHTIAVRDCGGFRDVRSEECRHYECTSYIKDGKRLNHQGT